MGQLHLMRLMSMQQQRQRRRRQAQAPRKNGMVASRTKRKRSPGQPDVYSEADEKKMYRGPSLPEDIWHHIHSLMPMRDAAQVASVSRAFLHSWRCHPTLTFSNESLGLNKNACGKDESASIFSSKVGHILAMHSGIGLKTLQIHIPSYFSTEDFCYVDSWLQTALRPGIEELTLILDYPLKANYNFPYSLLSNGSGETIRYMHLVRCSFHSAGTLGCLKSLTRLHLCHVRITREELECLLFNSLALERLEVRYCKVLVCLKVPCILQRLSHLEVIGGEMLEAIDNKAPNLSSFLFAGDNGVRISLGEILHMKRLTIQRSGSVFNARTKLPSTMPNLESLTLRSGIEASTPMLGSKFLHLRHLIITLHGAPFSPTFDYLSLANFLSAAPSLETFELDLWLRHMKHVSVFADSSDLRQNKEEQHHSLKSVTIKGFCSAKSLVELTCHIAESATSLECLTLEGPQSILRCSDSGNKSGKCFPLERDVLEEAHRATSAIRKYVEPKVPSTVKLNILEPCSCHNV